MNAGQTAAQIAATRTALAAMFSKPTFGTTLPPVSGSSDGWATITNQSAGVDPTPFNTLEIAGIAGESGYFDIDLIVDPLQLQKWPVSRVMGATTGTAGFSTADGVHESPTMNKIIAQSGIINLSWIHR